MMQTQTKTKETVTKAKCWNVYTCIYDVNSDKKQRKRKELKPNAENFTFIWRKLRQRRGRKELKLNAENFIFIWRKLRQKQRGERGTEAECWKFYSFMTLTQTKTYGGKGTGAEWHYACCYVTLVNLHPVRLFIYIYAYALPAHIDCIYCIMCIYVLYEGF